MIKILFIDLDSSVRNPDGTILEGVVEALKHWRGYVPIGLSSPACDKYLFDIEFPEQRSTLQQVRKLKAILMPTDRGLDCWQLNNSGEVRKAPDICRFGNYTLPHPGMIEFYLSQFLNRPKGWLVSDRPEAETPAAICGLQYISGVDWRGEQ